MKYLVLLFGLVSGCTAKENAATDGDEGRTAMAKDGKTSESSLEVVDFFSAKNGSNDGVQCPVVLVPGMFVGALQVGMYKQNIFSVGHTVKRLKNNPDNYLVGPFMVTITDGKVHQIEVELKYTKECISYNGKVIPKTSSLEDLQKVFPKCGPIESRFGGELSECQHVTVKRGSGADATPVIAVHK